MGGSRGSTLLVVFWCKKSLIILSLKERKVFHHLCYALILRICPQMLMSVLKEHTSVIKYVTTPMGLMSVSVMEDTNSMQTTKLVM